MADAADRATEKIVDLIEHFPDGMGATWDLGLTFAVRNVARLVLQKAPEIIRAELEEDS